MKTIWNFVRWNGKIHVLGKGLAIKIMLSKSENVLPWKCYSDNNLRGLTGRVL